MIYDILLSKLEAAGYVQGRTLFVGTIPGGVDRAVMLRVPLEGVAIDPYIPGRYLGPIQAVTRDADPRAGQDVANRVQKILRVEVREIHEANEQRGRVHLDRCQPRTLPVAYPRQESNVFEWAQTFDMIWGVKE